MSIILRDYQQRDKNRIYTAWNEGHNNVMYRSPTGSGKTVLFSDVLHDHQGAGISIAHRQELVGQISMALARDEVRHKILAPNPVIKFILAKQQRELGTTFFDPNAPIGVAGVDTLTRRADQYKHWLQQITLWIMDEGHHVLRENKWGKATFLMPNARGLAVTATPCRADGKGLGRSTDGLMDTLVEGETMRSLINQGWLTDYRIFAPPSDLDLTNVNISKTTGDYNPVKLRVAVDESHLVGDVVEHYRRIAYGKLCIVFATDVKTATDMAQNFNAQGIPSEVLSAKSKDSHRDEVLRRFAAREIWVLVNVDLFGEGFDLPAVEVVSMARPTQSYALYVQQFGRALRIMEGKNEAIIIDHASNVLRHGLPDAPRQWSLDARERRPAAVNADDDIPVRYCLNCTQPYPRINKFCTWCGFEHIPDGRESIEQVDGDLFELTPDALQMLRGEVDKADTLPELLKHNMARAGYNEVIQNSVAKNQRIRQEVQSNLRESMMWFGGTKKAEGYDDSQIYRSFYHLFGTDVMTAQALKKSDALILASKINNYLGNYRYEEA